MTNSLCSLGITQAAVLVSLLKVRLIDGRTTLLVFETHQDALDDLQRVLCLTGSALDHTANALVQRGRGSKRVTPTRDEVLVL